MRTSYSKHLSSLPWLIGLALTWPILATSEAAPYIHELVDTSGDTGRHVSIAVDAQNRRHLAYRDAANTSVKYAWLSGGTWSVETVDDTGDVGKYVSLDVDDAGEPHLAYRDATNNQLKYAHKSGGVWSFEIVDGQSDAGRFCSIAVDHQGRPHISYFEETNQDLKYAFKDGGWSVETVDSNGSSGSYSSLALDTQGRPHIAYRDITNDNVMYTMKSAGSWEPFLVRTVVPDCKHISIVLDTEDFVHVSFIAESFLYYAKKAAHGEWSGFLSENLNVVASDDASIGIDSRGNPTIAYINGYYYGLAEFDNDEWSFAPLYYTEPSAQEGYLSLAFDTGDNPVIGYYNINNGTLGLADSGLRMISPRGGERWSAGSQQTVRWVGSGNVNIMISEDGGLNYRTLRTSVSGGVASITVPGLTTETAKIRVSRSSAQSMAESPGFITIAPGLVSPWWDDAVASGGLSWYHSLALDSQDRPRISYHDEANHDLEYTYRSNGQWLTETVDSTDDVGSYSSLALSDDDDPVISYYDITNGDLKLAWQDQGSWAITIVDDVGDVGLENSLALDDNGDPRICYLDMTNFDLKFASWSEGSWSIETVDSDGNVGRLTSLALNSAGDPSICYYDDTNTALKFAHRANGQWAIETVDQNAGWGGNSLALDSQGHPHLSYRNSATGHLRYASKRAGVWTIEHVDDTKTGRAPSLVLDSIGNPHISYHEPIGEDLSYAYRSNGVWSIETLGREGHLGRNSSLAIDTKGNAHISYYDQTNLEIEYISDGIELLDPVSEVTWPVGATRGINWNGEGAVDLYLSLDGGSSWQLQAAEISGGTYGLQIPHTPTRFARLKLERSIPHATCSMPGLFTIESSIGLLELVMGEEGGGSTLVSWRTDPGPEDLSGYRLERDLGAGWSTLVSLTRDTSFRDLGASGARYRLFAINGLGEEILLGETQSVSSSLAAWPLPYRNGELNVRFATASGLGGGKGGAELTIIDVRGRRVRTLVEGELPAGYHEVTWDGRDESGRAVSSGLYFIRSRGGAQDQRMKVVVTR